MRTIIESVELREIYLDENDIQQEYLITKYLVKRAKDGYPIAQFKTYSEAVDFAREMEKC